MASIIFSAMPLRSNIKPMKMNMGMATSTQLLIRLKTRMTIMPRTLKSRPVVVSMYRSAK